MKHVLNLSGKHWLFLAVASTLLSGCSSEDRELQAYIDRIKARPGGAIEPLPQIRPAPSFVYEAGDRRSPFTPDVPQVIVGIDPGSVEGPDPNRARELLEGMPLDALSMVGTLRNNDGMFALLRDSEGRVHRVTVGNYLGFNYGRITSISESQIDLTEIISNRQGGWEERQAAVRLAGTNG